MTAPAYFSFQMDRIVAGVHDAVWRPRVLQAGRPPIVYLHGSGSSIQLARHMNDPDSNPGQRRIFRRLAEEGYPAVAVSHPDMWGNATLRTRVSAAIAYARSALGCVGPAILVGGSQGGGSALIYTYFNPTEVRAIVGILGVTDVQSIRSNPGLTNLAGDINAAWGITSNQALPTGANPAVQTASYQGLPMQWWYATDDPIVLPSTITTFAAAVPSVELNSLGNLSHTAAATDAVNAEMVLAFVEANS